ncbi:AAA family ATPase [Paenibacillus sp. HN-1]|uniref:ParA family protein n=1 Tax=Paenibacillus TaxID=44249 RepID=UPI001CA86A66|nr:MULTISPECIES: AAA family ATPase [Paenibacillus]MBY9077353.1 AAA family ATPase [Paenibacillus sp. CGMCC 1.18879]MBY9084665.1 AAA family ATPase [Paenibacillus sinensis]
MTKTSVITIANQKGGTGKTTTAYYLAYALLNEGKKVLPVDFNPAGSTSVLHVQRYERHYERRTTSIYSHVNIELIPSNIELSVAEINLRDEMGGEKTLVSLLEPMKPKVMTTSSSTLFLRWAC